MIVVQADNEDDEATLLIIVIEPDNFHRMEQADPITLNPAAIGGYLKPFKYPGNVRMVIAYESEPGRFYEMIQQGRTQDFVSDVMRGYRLTPIDGVNAPPKDWKSA